MALVGPGGLHDKAPPSRGGLAKPGVSPQIAQLPKGSAIFAAAQAGVSIGPKRASPQIGLALALLSLAALGLGSASYLSSGTTSKLWLADAGWTSSGTVAVLGSIAALRLAGRQERQGWIWLTVGSVAWLTGQLIWDAYGDGSIPASPNPADFCWLACAVAMAAGVRRLCRGVNGAAGVSLLETTPLIVAVGAAVLALLSSELRASHLSPLAQTTVLAYPILYVSAALVTLQAVIAGALDLRANKGLAAVLVGVALNAGGFILWSPQLLAGTYSAGVGPLDALWILGMALIGLGAWSSGPGLGLRRAEYAAARRGLLPALMFMVLAGIQIAFSAADGNAELVLSVGLLVVGASLIMHGSLLRRRQGTLLSELHAREHELRAVNVQLSHESRLDVLTGLANRLSLREDLNDPPEQYCVVLLDLDRFKDYNDAEGHQGGDRVLGLIGEILNANTRAGERAYRYGGEELLVILPDHSLSDGSSLAARLLEQLRTRRLSHAANPPHGIVTVSAGVAAVHPGESPQQVLRRADQALYHAKEQGRGRVVAAQIDEPEPTAPAPIRSRIRALHGSV